MKALRLILGVLLLIFGALLMRGTSAPANQEPSAVVPPTGAIWFGTTFDPETFEVAGRTSSVGPNEAFVLVAHLPKAVDPQDLILRVYLDNALVSTSGVDARGYGDVWGFSVGPLYESGDWRYEFTDIGGNPLAQGTVSAAR